MTSEVLGCQTERNARIACETLSEMGGTAGLLDLIARLKDGGMTEANATMAILDMTPGGYPNFDLANGRVSLPEA